MGGFLSVSAVASRLWLDASPSPLLACCATTGACDTWVHTGGSAVVWCSRCVLSEVFLGQPLAGRIGTALPCRLDEHPGDGKCYILLSTLLLLLRPKSLAIWPRPVSQAHRLILCSS
jgi:hypothetical protein